MILFLGDSGIITSWNSSVTVDDLVNYPHRFVEVDYDEDDLLAPEGYRPVYQSDGSIGFVPFDKPAEIDELAQLKQDNEKLKQDMAEQTAAILDIFNIILGGN